MLCNGFCELLAVVHPAKAAGGEILAHGPAVEIVRIIVWDVGSGFLRVVTIDKRIVGFGVALRGH